MAKIVPAAGLHDTVTFPSTTSIAVGSVHVAVAPAALVASLVIDAGTSCSDGGVVSRTVTVKVAWAVFALASVATQVTVVTPIAKSDPDAGVHATDGCWSTVSAAGGLVHETVAGEVSHAYCTWV